MARAFVLHARGCAFDPRRGHQTPMTDDVVEAGTGDTIDNFTSDNGKHFVEWGFWDDEKNGISYDTWVCITHHKQYYGDCAQKD
jgi:hypothetical protein